MTRTLDDWSTMFHLCLVILPPRREASAFIPIAERIFAVFGDADCHTAYCVMGNEFIAKRRARRRRGQVPHASSTPTASSCRASASRTCPRSCTSARTRPSSRSAEGWDPDEWQRVVKEIAKAMAWTYPEVARAGGPSTHARAGLYERSRVHVQPAKHTPFGPPT